MTDEFVDVPGPEMQELRDDVVKHAQHVVQTEEALERVRDVIDRTKTELEKEHDMVWEKLRESDIDDRAIDRLDDVAGRVIELENKMEPMWRSLQLHLWDTYDANLSRDEIRTNVKRGTLRKVLDGKD